MGSKEQKRTRGDGTIYKRGTLWHGELTLGWASDGKRVKQRFKGPTKKDVSAQIAKAKTAHASGQVPDTNATLDQFLLFWLPTYRQQVRATTYEHRHGHLTAHITPVFGAVRLADLTTIKVQAWVNDLSASRKPRTVVGIFNTLRKVLSDAVRMELLSRNVTKGVVLPKITHDELEVYSPEQAAQLFSAARGNDLEALYVLALTTGMRQGELLGLKWSDIDWPGQRLHIKRALVDVRGGGVAEQEPKTRSSRRGVPLTGLALDALKRRRIRQTEQRLQRGPLWADTEYVFTNTFGRPLRRAHLLDQQYYPLLERAGLPKIRFHNLRHSTATILLSMGVHPKVVQELLGHSSIKMTMDLYSHVTPTMSREAVTQLETLFVKASRD
jgi:integrase